MYTSMQNKVMGREERAAFIFGHVALFIVFVWFGALKMFDLSPATPLVLELFNHTLSGLVSFDIFNVAFGGFEVLIGILFIIPRAERIALALLIPHMLMTILPLFLLPDSAWTGALVPTLEGQYMIKNLVIVALAANIFADSRKR
jgi:uncharacterized membrane protein YkgB